MYSTRRFGLPFQVAAGARQRLLPLAIAALAAQPAMAQNAAQSVTALEEIVVVATKREESLQDVAVAVTALDATNIEARNISDLSEIGQYTPGLNYQTSAGLTADSRSVVYIRGIGQQEPLVHNDPGVAMYVDGIYLGRTQGSVLDLAGVQRVEVLRGPQGTLFGRNTSAGAINVITKKPDFDGFYGRVKAEVGEYSTANGQLSLNIPLIDDTMAMRLDLSSNKRDGYVDVRDPVTGDTVGEASDEDNQTARLALRWLISDTLEANLSADYTKRRAAPAGLRMISWDDAALAAQFGAPAIYDAGPGANPVPISQLVPPPSRYDNYASYNFAGLPPGIDFKPHDDQDIYGVGLTLDWQLADGLMLKSITGYREMDLDAGADNDGLPYHINSTISDQLEQDQFSQELQFNWDTTFMNFVGGVFWFEEEAQNEFLTNNFVSDIATPPPGSEYKLDTYDYDVETWAVYANATFHLSERWSIIAGVRYSEEDKELTYGNLNKFGTGPAVTRSVTPFGPVTKSDSWDSTTGKLGLNFEPNDNTLLYASISQGWKSGTFNTFGFSEQMSVLTDINNPPMAPPVNPPIFATIIVPNATAAISPAVLDQEEVLAYEVGIKSEWLDNRVRTNLSIFLNEYDDQQLVVVIPTMLGGQLQPVVTFTNVAESEISGAEFEFTAQLSSSFMVDASASYTDSKIKDTRAGIVEFEKGYQLPYTPHWQFSAGLSWEEQYSFGQLNARIDYAFKDGQHNYIGNTALDWQKSYGLWNARLGYRPTDNIEVYAWGKNIFDKEYDQATSAQGFPFHIGLAGAPRMVGAGLIYEF